MNYLLWAVVYSLAGTAWLFASIMAAINGNYSVSDLAYGLSIISNLVTLFCLFQYSKKPIQKEHKVEK